MSEQVSTAYYETMAMADRLGAAPLNKHEGCWEHRINDKWWVAANPHREPLKCSHGAEIPPFHIFVEYNGWPIAVLGPSGGTIIEIDPEYRSEDVFINLVKSVQPSHGSDERWSVSCHGDFSCIYCQGKPYRRQSTELIGECLVKALDEKVEAVRDSISRLRHSANAKVNVCT